MDIPEGAVVLNELRIVEYLNPEDGDIYKLNLSNSRGDEMSTEKYLELAEWSRILATAPILADIIHSYLFSDGEE